MARLGVDIGGTFTDVALEIVSRGGGERRFTTKILTTTRAPGTGHPVLERGS
jgi:N-methylhydantoinase A